MNHMPCCQFQLKYKASFSFADLVSYSLTLLNIPVKTCCVQGLGKEGNGMLCKFADSMLEKYRFTNSKTKRSTEFQVGHRLCNQRIAYLRLKAYRSILIVPVMAHKTLQKTRLWLHHFLIYITVPYPKAFV